MEGVRLVEVVKIAQCLLAINIQRLLCTVIKFNAVKEAIQSSSSLPFISNFNLFVNPYLKDEIQYNYCQFSPIARFIEVLNNRNKSNTPYFSLHVRLIEVSAEQGFSIKGNIRR